MAMNDTIDSITKLGTLIAIAVGSYFVLKKFGVIGTKGTNENIIEPPFVVSENPAVNYENQPKDYQPDKVYIDTKNYNLQPPTEGVAGFLLNPLGIKPNFSLNKSSKEKVTQKSLSPDVKMLLNGNRIPFTTSAVVSSASFVNAYKGNGNSALYQSAKSTTSKSLMKNNKSSVDLRSRLEKSKDILKK